MDRKRLFKNKVLTERLTELCNSKEYKDYSKLQIENWTFFVSFCSAETQKCFREKFLLSTKGYKEMKVKSSERDAESVLEH